MRLRRFYNNLRCALGFHRLKAWRDGGQGRACPIDPYGRPEYNDFRRCDWCGAWWRACYDGIELFWQRRA